MSKEPETIVIIDDACFCAASMAFDLSAGETLGEVLKALQKLQEVD